MNTQAQELLALLKRLLPFFVRDHRLRSGWRVAFYILASFAAFYLFALIFGVAVSFAWLSRGVPSDGILLLFADFSTHPFNYPDVAVTFILGRALLSFGVIWIFRKWIDRRSFLKLGFQMPAGWLRELGAGFAFSLAGWVVIFFLALVFSGAKIVGFAWSESNLVAILGALILGLFFNLLVGVAEEADARGYILQNLARGMRLKHAILLSAFYFGALHWFNPGGGWLSTLGIFVAGVLLAVGYIVTRRLWFSIGIHAAWNFAQGPIFGFAVSGLEMGGLFRLKITGPEWMMGGAFGPEAGALAVMVEIAMVWLLIAWKQSRLKRVQEFLSVFFWMR